MRLPPPYAGITGFRDSGQVHALLDLDPGRRELMVGVLASHASLYEQKHRPGSRSPAREDIAGIFPGTGYPTINLVHYFSEHTGNAGDLAGELETAMHWGGVNCHGLQLNITWPQRDALKGFKRVFPSKRIVLQVGGLNRSIEMEGDPATVAVRVARRYEGLADYVLFDASGGLGKEMDPLVMVRYLEPLADLIEEERIPMRLAVAGGLHPDNLHLTGELCSMFDGLSFDAEGRLHGTDGQLNIPDCRRYLRAAADMP